jgi:hypothetical protein
LLIEKSHILIIKICYIFAIKQGKSVMGSQKFILTDIVLMDIVGFSKLSNMQQYALISDFSTLFRKTLSIMCGGLNTSDFVLGIIPTGDGFYTVLSQSQKGFGAIYALFLKNIAKKLFVYDYFSGVKVAAHTGYLIPFMGVDGTENFIGNGMNQCARFLEFDAKQYMESVPREGYVVISSEAHHNLEILLEKNAALGRKVAALGVYLGEEVAFRDKHSNRYKGCFLDANSDAIITFPVIS